MIALANNLTMQLDLAASRMEALAKAAAAEWPLVALVHAQPLPIRS